MTLNNPVEKKTKQRQSYKNWENLMEIKSIKIVPVSWTKFGMVNIFESYKPKQFALHIALPNIECMISLLFL